MKFIYVFVSSLFFFCCSRKNSVEILNSSKISVPKIYTPVTSKKLLLENDILLLNGNLYSGFLYALDEQHQDTLLLQSYVNGLLQGICKKWYRNKQLMEFREYNNGKKHGKQIAYWENGNKRFEFVAINDAYEGELKEWSITGQLLHLANYTNGQENGLQKLWYDNGKIRANYIIIKGKRYGLLGTKNCKNVSDSIFNIK